MDKPVIKSDSEIIMELCNIITYQQKHIEELELENKMLKYENSTLKSQDN